MPRIDTYASQFLKTHLGETIKMFVVYDAWSRMAETYIAGTEAADGAHCIKTEYIYIGQTNRVEKMKESLAAWRGAWDI